MSRRSPGQPVVAQGSTEFNYVSLPEGGRFDHRWQTYSYQFDEGMSYFAAYRLPANTGNLAITLASQVNKTVNWFPKVIMLDAQFKVTACWVNRSSPISQPTCSTTTD